MGFRVGFPFFRKSLNLCLSDKQLEGVAFLRGFKTLRITFEPKPALLPDEITVLLFKPFKFRTFEFEKGHSRGDYFEF